MAKIAKCKTCGGQGHYAYQCFKTPKARIAVKRRPRQVSNKQLGYHKWLEEIARPEVIARDGNYCWCCKRSPQQGEKLDLEHTLGKGAHPELKRSIPNLRLYCRFPCHFYKTINKPCPHGA